MVRYFAPNSVGPRVRLARILRLVPATSRYAQASVNQPNPHSLRPLEHCSTGSHASFIAIDRIGEHDQGLAEHLRLAVRTGMFCAYMPPARDRVAWKL